MPEPLDPERLARWRTWALKWSPRHPDWREERDRHRYDGQCCWCRTDDYPEDVTNDGYIRDGNSHDNALVLLDYIAQLEARVLMLETMLGGVLT